MPKKNKAAPKSKRGKSQPKAAQTDAEIANEIEVEVPKPTKDTKQDPLNQLHYDTSIYDIQDQSNLETSLNKVNKKLKADNNKDIILKQDSNDDKQLVNTETVQEKPSIIYDIDPNEKILPREYFTVDAVVLARNLLGKLIVRRVGDQLIKCRIVETEAYAGVNDRASHGHKGKLTDRTKPLFLRGGHLYVYLIYGLSHMVNITATEEGEPTAVLIRACEVVEGYDFVAANRKMKNLSKTGKELTNGPGKVCAALKVDKSLNCYDITQPGHFYITEDYNPKPFDIVVSKRINVDYAGTDADLPYRFYIKDNQFVSVKGIILETVTPVEFSQVEQKKALETVMEEFPSVARLEKYKFNNK